MIETLIALILIISQQDPPSLAVSPDPLDFGEVFAGDKPMASLKVTNKGAADLHLLGIAFNCGCTLSRIVLPSGEEREIVKDRELGVLKSGETAALKIAFSTQGLIGDLKRKLTIRSNDPQRGELDLKMTIRIKSPCNVEPAIVDFGEVLKGTSVTKKVTITSAGIGAFKMIGVKHLPPYITYEKNRIDDRSIELLFHIEGKTAAGRVQLKPVVEIEAEKGYTVNLFFRANLLSDITFTLVPKDRAGVLDLGKMDRNRGGEGEVLITNRKPGVPYEITRIQVLCRQEKFIETSVETVEKGGQYRVLLKIKSGVPARFLQGELVIFSTHPDEKRKRIRFSGWIE